MEFGNEGLVRSCCPVYTKMKETGNIKYENIEEIWNGKKMRRMRRLMLLGDISKICFPYCPWLASKPIVIDDLCESLKEDLKAGNTVLRLHPRWFRLSNWGACNLRCIMCRSHTDVSKVPDYVVKTHDNLKDFLTKEVNFYLTGDGDFLARSDTRDFLRTFPQDKYPNVRFSIITNALLLPKYWNDIKHCKYTWIHVSVDAATKDTYEKIRRGARWERLMETFELLKKLKEAGRFRHVIISMTVMRSNYKEIPAFVKMARQNGFLPFFGRIYGSRGDENIFEMNDEEALEDLRRILSDPDIYREDIDLIRLSEFVPPSFRRRLYNSQTEMFRAFILQTNL